MAEEEKNKIEKLNEKNCHHWKMQIEDYLYQKDLYLPLEGIEKKPTTMTEDAWKVLDRKAWEQFGFAWLQRWPLTSRSRRLQRT